MAWPQTSTTTNNLNLRADSNTGAQVLTVMPKGSAVNITGQAVNGWYPVEYNGQTGWASAQYFNAPVETPTTQYGTTTNNLNLRSAAGTSNDILTVIPKAGSVTITGPESNGWYPVTYNGQSGWVSGKYLTGITSEAPGGGTGGTTPPNTTPIPHTPGGSNPFYNPDSTHGSYQNWYNTPLVTQNSPFASEYEKFITDQGLGGVSRKSEVARGLMDRAQSGYAAAQMNNPGLTGRDYLQSLGSTFLRNTMAKMSPGQRGETPGLSAPRSRWIDR